MCLPSTGDARLGEFGGVSTFYFSHFFWLETVSYYVAPAGLELKILLPVSPCFPLLVFFNVIVCMVSIRAKAVW
jgi:hypothetical protein